MTEKNNIYVAVTMHTGDFITPTDGDMQIRLAEMCRENGVICDMLLVGEAVRKWEKEKREDVVASLNGHEVGYHTDLHSVHPMIADYMKGLSWQEGIEEFEKREGKGMEDIKRVFGKMPISYCIGADLHCNVAQGLIGLRNMGIKVYLFSFEDFLTIKGPLWFCGLLVAPTTTFYMGHNPIRPQFFEWWTSQFKDIYRSLNSKEGGIIDLYFHPNDLLVKKTYDSVNFFNGNNTPRSQWKIPPLKSQKHVENSFAHTEKVIKFLRDRADNGEFKLVTGKDMLGIFPDRAKGKVFELKELIDKAGWILDDDECDFKKLDGVYLSVAELFSLINSFLCAYIRKKKLPVMSGFNEIITGPSRRVKTMPVACFYKWNFFEKACLDTEKYIKENKAVPTGVLMDGVIIAPDHFLYTMLYALEEINTTAEKPEEVILPPLNRDFFNDGKYFDDKTITKHNILSKDFNDPNRIEFMKLQSWTLKPAQEI